MRYVTTIIAVLALAVTALLATIAYKAHRIWNKEYA